MSLQVIFWYLVCSVFFRSNAELTLISTQSSLCCPHPTFYGETVRCKRSLSQVNTAQTAVRLLHSWAPQFCISAVVLKQKVNSFTVVKLFKIWIHNVPCMKTACLASIAFLSLRCTGDDSACPVYILG